MKVVYIKGDNVKRNDLYSHSLLSQYSIILAPLKTGNKHES